MGKEKFDIKKFSEPIKKYHIKWSEECYEELLNQSEVIERASELILNRKNIFLAADGRSKDMLFCVGKRFLGMGFQVYGTGEHFTISMKDNRYDILLGTTGTGTSHNVINAGNVARTLKVPFVLVTSYENSPAAQLADEKIIIKGRTKDTIERDYESRQLIGESTEVAGALGSQFEYKAFETLECLANYIGHKKGTTEKQLKDRHPNI